MKDLADAYDAHLDTLVQEDEEEWVRRQERRERGMHDLRFKCWMFNVIFGGVGPSTRPDGLRPPHRFPGVETRA